MPDFEFNESAGTGRRGSAPGPSWLHTFSAVFVGAVLAGAVLLLGVRAYVYWSLSDALKDKAPAKTTKP